MAKPPKVPANKVVLLDVSKSRYSQSIQGQGGFCNCRKKNSEDRCSRIAGWGTDHVGYGACKNHGGNSPSGKTAATRTHVRELAEELDLDPYTALLYTVRLAAGVVAWCRNKIGELEDPATEFADEDDEKRAINDLAVMLRVYGEERDRLAKTAKLAIDAGIDERRISLEEEQGELIAKAVTGILQDLKLTPQQRKDAPAIARRHLALLAG